jgi:hypothetical protein
VLLLLLPASVAAFGVGSSSENDASPLETAAAITADEQYSNLVAWMRSNGGRVDDRFGVTTSSSSPDVRRAVALRDIAAGTELLFTPWRLVLGTIGDTSTVPTEHCEVLQTYAGELRAGQNSFWYPYLSMDQSLTSSIPTIWQPSALAALQGLLPDTSAPSLTQWFSENCAGHVPFDELDQASRHSLLAAITRAAGMRFLPLFDLMNHHNGKLNTRSHASVAGNSVFAAVDIPQGTELFSSYRGERTTTTDIFRRYGFVEAWPQQWAWTDPMTAREERFLLLPDHVAAIYPPDSMAVHIGTTAPLLADFQATAESHNRQLESSALVEFSASVTRLLESLPTTVEEDGSILTQLLLDQELVAVEGEARNDSLHSEMASAVSYRMHFKEALRTALNVATSALTTRQSSREL